MKCSKRQYFAPFADSIVNDRQYSAENHTKIQSVAPSIRWYHIFWSLNHYFPDTVVIWIQTWAIRRPKSGKNLLDEFWALTCQAATKIWSIVFFKVSRGEVVTYLKRSEKS